MSEIISVVDLPSQRQIIKSWCFEKCVLKLFKIFEARDALELF